MWDPPKYPLRYPSEYPQNTKIVFLEYFSGIFGVCFRSPGAGEIRMLPTWAGIFALFWGLRGFCSVARSWVVNNRFRADGA